MKIETQGNIICPTQVGYYRYTIVEVPSSSFYGFAEGSQAAMYHPSVYYDIVPNIPRSQSHISPMQGKCWLPFLAMPHLWNLAIAQIWK